MNREEVTALIVRLLHRVYDRVGLVIGPHLDIDPKGKLRWLRLVPPLPRVRRREPVRAWPEPNKTVPTKLRGSVGIQRNPVEEQRAFKAAPLPDFTQLNAPAIRWAIARGWGFLIPTAPRTMRAMTRALRVGRREPAQADPSPEDVTERIRREAVRLGLSAIGFARHDPRYTFAEFADQQDETIIVCISEQDWEATQTAPSLRAERAAFRSYADVIGKAADLARFVQDLGFRARPHPGVGGEGVVIHYGVEAGLGQLGLNGQLLTPQAGSRARISLMSTNAKVVYDQPVDYGIEAICDECQLCVRRCPVGAIPKARREHRGITKAKIKTERCFPTVAQAHGCAICMKVCPVQRYGLDPVREHLHETGEIMGKGTDELEGYPWPVDGRYYGSGDKPALKATFINPPDFPGVATPRSAEPPAPSAR